MKPRLLVIDDDETISVALKRYLELKHDFEVHTAAEQKEAEALLAKGRYDVVIADLQLGSRGTEGIEVVRAMRERCVAAPVLVLTAFGSLEIRREVLRSGAAEILNKPLPLADVAAAVIRLMEAAR